MDRNQPEEKRVTRYMQKKYSGGKSVLARVIDYIALRLIIFFGAYLAFLPRFAGRATIWLLSAITLALSMLVLRLLRGIRYERLFKKEWERVRGELLIDRLLLLDMQTAIPLVSSLCPADTAPVILQRALPVDANALLALVRTHRGCGALHVFSCTAYDSTALAFAARANGMLTLHKPEELLSAARKAGMRPSDEEVNAAILAKLAFEKESRRKIKPALFAPGSARKYLVVALLLTGMSFATGYALYYRLLAGLSMTIAAYCIWRDRSAVYG